MSMERPKESEGCFSKAHSSEPCAGGAVSEIGPPGRVLDASPGKDASQEKHSPNHSGGRPHKRWKIRVVRIDVGKYPEYARDKDHPFARMAAEVRVEEMDSFFARLRVRTRALKPTSGGLSSAA